MHIPVLANEVLESFDLKPNATVIDGTVGLGGHAALMLKITAPDGKLIGFDRDARNLVVAKQNLAEYSNRVTLIHDSFGSMESHGLRADAILLDLGFSSVHVDDASRGFSFQNDGPLDMRYDTEQKLTAADIVNGWSLDEIAAILRKYGEEPRAADIARAITAARKEKKFVTTLDLARNVETVVHRHGRIHPATATFQALRIAVNDELGEVERGLKAAESVLNAGGRIGVITFHSLEDRIVKNFFKENAVLTAVNKKPIVPTREEIAENPRSRSAKFRVAQKI